MNATFQTQRLHLRPCTVDDVDLFLSTWGDADVMRTFGPGVPVSEENIEQHLNEGMFQKTVDTSSQRHA